MHTPKNREGEMMSSPGLSPKNSQPTVTIRVSGKLFHGHLSYLKQLVDSAIDCQLLPVLNLAHLEELDREAVVFLIHGENRDFGIDACPNFIREWMQHEREREAAA
jgi:hypothetical protein